MRHYIQLAQAPSSRPAFLRCYLVLGLGAARACFSDAWPAHCRVPGGGGLSVAAAVVFLAQLGFPAANVGYGLLISLHATSIVFRGRPVAQRTPGFALKLGAAFATLFAVWGLIYAPLVDFAERHWFMPLRQGDRVLVVQRGVPAELDQARGLAGV